MTESILSPQALRSLVVEQRERFDRIDLGIPREALLQVRSLLKSPHVVALTGLRRAGKSTLQAQVAHACFPNDFHYLNFDDERWAGCTAADFQRMQEALLTEFGDKHHFLLDEVQNIPGWERFVRRLHDSGYKVIVTGSNATLLSREIGAHLTGRHHTLEIFPFSFSEYLAFHGIAPAARTTQQTAQLKRALNAYLRHGGIPDAVKYPHQALCAQLYQDIIYRDISARYALDSLKSLREMALFLVSNVGRPVSFNKVRQMLMLGSVNTVKSYLEYLEASWLFLTVTVYSPSVKQQQIAPKKIYCIDNGLIDEVAFHSSADIGWRLENLVFLSLRRRTMEVFYAKNPDGSEVDFLIREGTRPAQLIQATMSLDGDAARKREVASLLKGMAHYKLREGTIVTLDHEEEIRVGRARIHVVPLLHWLR
ncbi:MAG: ATP-binding protein [Deltaproteobacteria bacterium]|nr:ATP-binding protein [Deltaproteobacteria bacterium]